jgi:hypothetical protein
MFAGEFCPPELQNLFDLGYFKGSKEMVPTGWQEVDEDKTYPTLASRNPQLQQATEEDFEMTNGHNGSEISDEDDNLDGTQNAYSTKTRMNDESSEDELSRPATTSRVSLDPILMMFVCSIPQPVFFLFRSMSSDWRLGSPRTISKSRSKRSSS